MRISYPGQDEGYRCKYEGGKKDAEISDGNRGLCCKEEVTDCCDERCTCHEGTPHADAIGDEGAGYDADETQDVWRSREAVRLD